MADSLLQPKLEQLIIILATAHVYEIRHAYLDALKNLSLANVETTYSSLDSHRSHMPPFLPLPFLHPKASPEGGVVKTYDQFALSAAPDDFVTVEDWTEQDPKKPYGDVIQRLEYSGIDSNDHGGGDDNWPQYIFQLGRLMLPAAGPIVARKLPFVVVVDILDPRKAVWLIHVRDIAEDPEEGEEWYPSQYVLNQLACLFDGSNRRDPVYHIAQVAPSLEEWLTLDYDTMINNIHKTRRRGNLKIKMACVDEFKSAISTARTRKAIRIVSPVAACEGGLDRQRGTHSNTALDMVS